MKYGKGRGVAIKSDFPFICIILFLKGKIKMKRSMTFDSQHKEDEVEALNEKGNETDNRKAEKDKRKYKLGICVFCVLNVHLISLIGNFSYKVCSEKNAIFVQNSDICVPCEDLRLHPDDIIEGIERRRKDKKICCVVEEEGPNALLGYYTDHWLKMKLATDTDRQFIRYKCGDEDSIEPRKPIIKLVGKHEKQTAEHHKLHWDGDHEMAIVPVDGSITHRKEHGFIEIKKSGLYHVYNQVVLDHDGNGHNYTLAPDVYMHKIILIAANTTNLREITLMKTSNSYCKTKTNRQTITNYLGGPFQLSKGDKLAIRINKTELVPIPHMNFFGAYML